MRAAQQAIAGEVKALLNDAAVNASKTAVTQASRAVAEQAAKEWVGNDARVLVNRQTKVPIELESADGTKVARFTSVSKAQPYVNLENKVTGGNLHVRF